MTGNKFTILDGAMGTMLQAAGLPMGTAPELWNTEHPEIITEIGKSYIAAGSDIIYANTFGANRHKLGETDVAKIIESGVRAAKAAAEGTNARVALDIGPIGRLLEPLGTLSFDEAYDIFKEAVIAGRDAGADLIVFETMSDLYEAKAAVLAAKENTDLPIFVTMTFEKSGRTFVGATVPAMALTLSGLGVDALGFNCSLGPKDLIPLIKTLREWTSLPIIVKPNAGLPDPETGKYSMTTEEFADAIAKACELGATVFGGCCGTTPDYIAAVKKALKGKSAIPFDGSIRNGVCSVTKAVELRGVRVIGERINPTGKKRFQQALRDMDMGYILEQAISQQDAGADILDINVGLPDIDEKEMMRSVVCRIQSVVNLPLQIDSSNICAIEAGLRYSSGKPIVNSVNGDDESLDKILPLCKKYGAAVIALTMDKHGIPQTADERIAIAGRIIDRAEHYGISRKDIIVDCLTLTVSAQQSQAKQTLDAVRYISKTLGMHTTLGVSNISFGLPNRDSVTAAFLCEALASGLDMPIINPNSKPVMDAVYAHRALSGEDCGCTSYIDRFANAVPAVIAKEKAISIGSAIENGLCDEVKRLTLNTLDSMSEMDIVNTLLIPALDSVGEKYEKQKIFLPQLMNSANAACAGFEVIKKRLAQKGVDSVSKGKIIVATVKGDIHDIGKNIVKVVLENYGYTVIDLGKDTDPELIVKTAINENVRLIGLSALMTTTVSSMADTIKAVRESGHDCKIWVGGAVLTAEYADKIGADFYARDAKQSVDIAKRVLR